MPSPTPPRYDQGLRYDTGVRYALAGGGSSPTPTPTKKPMAKIKFTVSRTPADVLIKQARLTGKYLKPAAPAVPPHANMVQRATDLLAAADAAEGAVAIYEAAKAALDGLKIVRDQKVDALRQQHTATIALGESETLGDDVALAAMLYPLASGEIIRAGVPGQVRNLALTWNEADGSLDGSHDPIDEAASYKVELTTVDPLNGPYHEVLTPTASSWQLTGLTSGSRVWIRVRAIGTKGQGPWSDPATKIVP